MYAAVTVLHFLIGAGGSPSSQIKVWDGMIESNEDLWLIAEYTELFVFP